MIKQTIQTDLTSAMKAQNTETTQTLRYILAQIKNKEIDKQSELTDEEVTDVLYKEAKKLQESIDSFHKGGREDLCAQSQTQRDIVQKYLPQEMDEETLKIKVQVIINENKELFQKNPHALIGICIKKLKSAANSGRVAAAVKEHI